MCRSTVPAHELIRERLRFVSSIADIQQGGIPEFPSFRISEDACAQFALR